MTNIDIDTLVGMIEDNSTSVKQLKNTTVSIVEGTGEITKKLSTGQKNRLKAKRQKKKQARKMLLCNMKTIIKNKDPLKGMTLDERKMKQKQNQQDYQDYMKMKQFKDMYDALTDDNVSDDIKLEYFEKLNSLGMIQKNDDVASTPHTHTQDCLHDCSHE